LTQKMARKSKSGGPNKTQAIKDYYAENPDAKPAAAAEALNAQGIEVTSGFVSTIKSKHGLGKKRRGRRKGAAKKASTGAPSERVAIADLVKAKKLADQLGGVEKAKAMLDALSKLN